MITKFLAWLKRQLHCGWQRGWHLQGYADYGYNGDIISNGDDLLLESNTHDDVEGYRIGKCEIARKVKKPNCFEFDFTIYNFTKQERAYTIIQQFWSKPLAPICYLTLERRDGKLKLHMQNKVHDNSDRGYSVKTYHTFILDEDSRTSIVMDFSSHGFAVECNGEDSGWHETPFLNYKKCWIKAGMYWSWGHDKPNAYKMTIHKAKVS